MAVEEDAGILGVLRHRSFAGLWAAGLISTIGDWAVRIALAVLILDRTGSAFLSALVVVAAILPWVGPGQLLATRLSHIRPNRLMVGADLFRAAVYALLLIHLPVAAVLGLVLIAGLATPPFDAARSTLTVATVPEADYGAAITLLDMTDQAAVIVGYLAGGLWVAAGGATLAISADVVSFVLSAAILVFLRDLVAAREARPAAAQLRRALGVAWSDPVIRRGLTALLLAALPVAAIEATAAGYARFALHAGARTAGELAAAVPAGILLTIPFLPRTGGARRLMRVSAATALVGGLVGAAAFGAGHLIGAFVGYGAAGVLTASATPAQVAFQPRIHADDRAGIFSLAAGTIRGAEAIGAALGGLLLAGLGARPSALVWTGLVVVVGLALLARPIVVPGHARPPGADPPES